MDPQELLVRAMIGQQITVAAARTALTQLSAAGSASLVPGDGLDRLFPTAAEIAGSGYSLLRGPQRRIDSLRSAASALAGGELDFGYGDDLPGLAAKLLPLPGVGPWTVGYVAMRVLGAPDVFLANDAAVRNGIRALAPDGTGPGAGAPGPGNPLRISGKSARGGPTPPCTCGAPRRAPSSSKAAKRKHTVPEKAMP